MTRQETLTSCSLVHVVEEQVSCNLDNEIVVLSLKSGMYYGLDSVGGRIWRLLDKPIAVEGIVRSLLEEYDISREQLEAEVMGFLKQLLNQGLIQIKSEPVA